MLEAIALDIKDLIENGFYFLMIKLFEGIALGFIALID